MLRRLRLWSGDRLANVRGYIRRGFGQAGSAGQDAGGRAGAGIPPRVEHMPQWAGSCWYYLRYLDKHNDDALVTPEVEDTDGLRRGRSAGAWTCMWVGPSKRSCICFTPVLA
jgi:hypothetical protein